MPLALHFETAGMPMRRRLLSVPLFIDGQMMKHTCSMPDKPSAIMGRQQIKIGDYILKRRWASSALSKIFIQSPFNAGRWLT